jgi:DNA-binding transcriptional LysR family regulator
MDRIEAMSTLLAVVEAGSLSAASRKLRVPLTSVSRRISDLEAHLKTQLLNRSSRRVTLTDAAQSYIQACRRILDELDEAERVVSGEYRAPQGELTVTASLVSAAFMWCRSRRRF